MVEFIFAIAFGWLSSETASPPVITTSTRVEQRERALLAWLPGEVRCGGEIVAAQPMRRPLTSVVWRISSEQGALAFTFGIDRSGRTINIRLAPGSTLSNRRLIREIGPSLAATTFPSNNPFSECVINYAPRVTPLKDTPVADLVSYSVNPVSGRLPREGWSRISGDGDCGEQPTPAVKTRAHPAFRSLPATPGVKDWVMIGYDLDESGRPVNIDLIYGTGNEGLARAGKEAVAGSEFYDGP